MLPAIGFNNTQPRILHLSEYSERSIRQEFEHADDNRKSRNAAT
jgi:hypothetical protein